jgi:hypothetical protein
MKKILAILTIAFLLAVCVSVSAHPPESKITHELSISADHQVVVDHIIEVEKITPDIDLDPGLHFKAEATITSEKKVTHAVLKYRRQSFYAKYVLKLPDTYDKTKNGRLRFISYRA